MGLDMRLIKIMNVSSGIVSCKSTVAYIDNISKKHIIHEPDIASKHYIVEDKDHAVVEIEVLRWRKFYGLHNFFVHNFEQSNILGTVDINLNIPDIVNVINLINLINSKKTEPERFDLIDKIFPSSPFPDYITNIQALACTNTEFKNIIKNIRKDCKIPDTVKDNDLRGGDITFKYSADW